MSGLLSRASATALLVALAAGRPEVAAAGVAVEGTDRARILPPSGARIDDYENAGYRLLWRGGEAHVEVVAAPLGSAESFEPRRPKSRDAVSRLAWAQANGAATRFEVASRILDWVSRHVEYRLDRSQPQSAAAVLERRSAYCTGVARLTVALLEAIGIEAREVVGYVAESGSGTVERGYLERGYHRWVEIYFPDRGWVFSDPLTSHHYVPATYVRLASDQLEVTQGLDGLLLERDDRIAAVDVHHGSAAGVTVRRNSQRRQAAALFVSVREDVSAEGSKISGQVMLRGASTLYRHDLTGGQTTFVGLEPGRYQLSLVALGRELARHVVELPDRRAVAVEIGGLRR